MKDYVPPTRQKCPGGRYAIPGQITRATMEVSCPGLCPLGKFGTLEGSVMDFVAEVTHEIGSGNQDNTYHRDLSVVGQVFSIKSSETQTTASGSSAA